MMKLSARNVLSGKVVGPNKGQTTAHVSIALTSGTTVTASIIDAAIVELGLEVGDDASDIVKTSDVIIGKN